MNGLLNWILLSYTKNNTFIYCTVVYNFLEFCFVLPLENSLLGIMHTLQSSQIFTRTKLTERDFKYSTEIGKNMNFYISYFWAQFFSLEKAKMIPFYLLKVYDYRWIPLLTTWLECTTFKNEKSVPCNEVKPKVCRISHGFYVSTFTTRNSKKIRKIKVYNLIIIFNELTFLFEVFYPFFFSNGVFTKELQRANIKNKGMSIDFKIIHMFM